MRGAHVAAMPGGHLCMRLLHGFATANLNRWKSATHPPRPSLFWRSLAGGVDCEVGMAGGAGRGVIRGAWVLRASLSLTYLNELGGVVPGLANDGVLVAVGLVQHDPAPLLATSQVAARVVVPAPQAPQVPRTTGAVGDGLMTNVSEVFGALEHNTTTGHGRT
jgi:hypothetical protein